MADPAGNPDLYVIAVARASGSPALAAFAFLGGVSAASAMVLVTLLALSAMCMNYIVSLGAPDRRRRATLARRCYGHAAR